MTAADDVSFFLCDQIGDRVRAILSPLPATREARALHIAGDRLLYCSGAASCGWFGPAPGRANPCAYQRALEAGGAPAGRMHSAAQTGAMMPGSPQAESDW